MVGDRNFLGKDITIRKNDGTAVRGFCVNQTPEGIMVNPKNRDGWGNENRFVFIPYQAISEVFFEEGGNNG